MANEEPKPKSTAQRLEEAIQKQVDYFTEEYDLTIGETVSALEMVKAHMLFRLYQSCTKPPEDMR